MRVVAAPLAPVSDQSAMPMASGDEHGESEPTLTVAVRLPHLGESATPLTRVVAATSSVRDLKADLARTLDGEPKQDGIVCVLGGRVLRDSEVLGSLAGAQADECGGGHGSADDDGDDGEGRESSAGQADNKVRLLLLCLSKSSG